MRTLLVVALLALVPVSGCLARDAPPEPGGAGDASDTATAAPVLPDNISAEETVIGATPLSGLLSTGSCGDVASGTCYRYEVDLVDPARMTATLTWMLPANDFDLILLEDGDVRDAAQDLPPGTEATVTADLAPGTYELLVVAFLVSSDTFHLQAVFTSR